jgi:uncharacterized phage protein gp47/JayE
MTYVEPDLSTDEAAIAQTAYDLVSARVSGWQPSTTSLDTALLESAARLAAELRTLVGDVSDLIVQGLATGIFGYARRDALGASVTATFTLANAIAGFTIPVGTRFGLTAADGSLIAFETVDDVTTDTTTATIGAVAVEPGSNTNDLTGAGTLIDAVVNVATVSAITTSAGGDDQESEAAYLDRIVRHLQLLAIHPILPNDYSLLAMETEGVARALAVDGYDPVANTYGHARTVALFLQDSLGQAVPGATKTAVQANVASYREVNFVVTVDDPLLTPITIVVGVKKADTVLASEVQIDVQDALVQYLAPSTWGLTIDQGQLPWVPRPIIYLNELIAVAGNVRGVVTVTSLTINGVAADYTMQGGRPQALPQLTGTPTVNVT